MTELGTGFDPPTRNAVPGSRDRESSFGVAGEPFSDGVDRPGEVFAVDALHDRCGVRVGLQLVQALAVGGCAGVRVGSGVGEPVAVGRASAEETALQRRLGDHRGPDADRP